MPDMTAQEIWDFLSAGTRTAHVAPVNASADGTTVLLAASQRSPDMAHRAARRILGIVTSMSKPWSW